MPASTPATPPAATPPASTIRRPAARQVFRRRSTVISSFVLAGVLFVIAAALTPDEFGHGFFAPFAALAGVAPLIVLALVAGAWPHVLVTADRVEVHNSFFWYDVPFAAVSEIRKIRLGLIVRTNAEQSIPATAYTSGSAGKMLGHVEAADTVIHAVENRMEFLKRRPEDESAGAIRHVEKRNVWAVLGTVVVCVGLIYGAVNTYH